MHLLGLNCLEMGPIQMSARVTSSGYDVQGDHSIAGWLKGQVGRALKFGCFQFAPAFSVQKNLLISGIVGESCVLKEVDDQDEIFTEVFEYMNVVHNFFLVNFKWDRVHTLTLNLVSGGRSHGTDHVEFLWSFSHWEHLPKFGGCHAADVCPCIIQCTDFMSIDIYGNPRFLRFFYSRTEFLDSTVY
jgi:hypothetical protein